MMKLFTSENSRQTGLPIHTMHRHLWIHVSKIIVFRCTTTTCWVYIASVVCWHACANKSCLMWWHACACKLTFLSLLAGRAHNRSWIKFSVLICRPNYFKLQATLHYISWGQKQRPRLNSLHSEEMEPRSRAIHHTLSTYLQPWYISVRTASWLNTRG